MIKNHQKNLWLFVLLIGLESIAANLAHPITPTIINNMHLPSYMFGVAYSVMAFSNFLFSPFWAKMVNMIGNRKTLFITMSGYALGQLLFMLSNNSAFLIIARFVSGMFAGGIYVAFLTYIVNNSEGAIQGKFLTMNATIQTIAGSIGFLVGGLLGEVSLKLTFIFQVIMLISVGILFLLVCKEDSSDFVFIKNANFKNMNPFKAFIDAKPFITPFFVILFAAVLLSSSATTTFDQNFNYYLKDVLGLTSKYNGTIKGVVGIISLIANLTICMYIIKKKNVSKSLIALFLIAFVTLIFTSNQKAVLPFMIGSLIYYGINAIYIPLIQGVVAENTEAENKNIIMGLYNSMKSMGMVLGGLVAGFLYSIAPNVPFIVSALLFMVAAILMFVSNRVKQGGNKNEKL